MNSYSMQPYSQEQDKFVDQDYKQDLGFKKMLYKYQYENQQLKNQIKALTQKLQIIMVSKSTNTNTVLNHKKQSKETFNANEKTAQHKLHQYWNQQYNFFYKRIEHLNAQIRSSRQSIDDQKQLQYIKLADRIRAHDNTLHRLRQKLSKFQSEQQVLKQANSKRQSVKVGLSEEEIEKQLITELEDSKKRVREMERTRNTNQKKQRNKHLHIVDIDTKIRQLTAPRNISRSPLQQIQRESSPKKFGLWGLELTKQNYAVIQKQFRELKNEKNNLLRSIRIQNSNLQQKLVELKNNYIDLSANNEIVNNSSMEMSRVSGRKVAQQKIRNSLDKDSRNQSIVLPQIPLALGKSAYERKNDKNFVEKKAKIIEWVGNAKKGTAPGLGWNDEGCKSPITGINFWMDKYLMGIQFIHTLGQSNQHLHMVAQGARKITPIQYRLNNNDYLQNVVLVLMTNPPKPDLVKDSIVGVQFYSKNGRKDVFGMKLGSAGTQKFDFGIKTPQKPIYSFGSFTISAQSNVSCINKIGFTVV